jgi:DNA polymerase-3 subunit alpha
MNAQDMLEAICFSEAEAMGISDTERIRYELNIIEEKGLADYFLIVRDVISHARQTGILVGPGRGSAAGSLVSYLIGITRINPLEHDLLFERFLNPTRQDPADIDTDFQSTRREEVIDYLRDRYGMECVAKIPTISRYGVKVALRDLSRIESIPIPEVNNVTAKIPTGASLNEALHIPEVRDFCKKYPRVGRLLPDLYGSVRHRSIHAAGVVITPTPISDYFSMERVTREHCVCFDKDVVEQLGLLKLDILGLRTLDVIQRAITLINEYHDIEIDQDSLPSQFNDPDVFEIFRKGLTLGVFQFETQALTEFSKKMEVDSFELLTATTALIRPGPLHSGDADRYLRRKNGKEAVSYMHDSLKDILGETYGVILYQEQIMQVVNQVGGLPLSDAENIRKLVSKSKGSEALDKYKDAFINGAILNGVEEGAAESIWDTIREAGAYSFNKSHAVSYTAISYWCAWLKLYYPREFLVALMDFEEDEILTQATIELRELGYDVRMPHINDSGVSVEVDKNGDIIFGLSNVKNVGPKAIDDILAKRPFKSFDDFMERRNGSITNVRVIRHLVQAGAFDDFGERYKLYYEVTPDEEYHEWTEKEMVLKQVDVLEMPPHKAVSDFYDVPFDIPITPIKDIDWSDVSDEVYIKGTIVSFHMKEGYAYMNLTDGTGTVNVLLGEEQIYQYKNKIDFDNNANIILKAHMVEGRERLYSDMMIDLEKYDKVEFEKEYEYMDNGRQDTLRIIESEATIQDKIGLVVTSGYFTSKKGNRGCRILLSNTESLMCFQDLREDVMPGDIIKYSISKKPFINIHEKW